jgi:hypothetical protein
MLFGSGLKNPLDLAATTLADFDAIGVSRPRALRLIGN